MITPVQDNDSGISQLFFQKSFPKPKEEPLLTIKKKGSGASGAGEDDGEPGTEVTVDRATFAAFLQAELGGSRTAETGGVKQESRSTADRPDASMQERFRKDSSSAVSSDILKMKIRMQQGGETNSLFV